MVRHLEANRYEVQMGSGGLYLVDLDEFYSGWCACRDFECKHLPALIRLQDQGCEEFPLSECKHLAYLRQYLRIERNKK